MNTLARHRSFFLVLALIIAPLLGLAQHTVIDEPHAYVESDVGVLQMELSKGVKSLLNRSGRLGEPRTKERIQAAGGLVCPVICELIPAEPRKNVGNAVKVRRIPRQDFKSPQELSSQAATGYAASLDHQKRGDTAFIGLLRHAVGSLRGHLFP